MDTVKSLAGLKEWAITGEALAQGRQIVLLRKGGLLDEEGAFALEHSQFFLLPSWFHAERGLVKDEHLDLWQQTPRAPDEGPKVAYIRHFAQVEKIWRLFEDAEAALGRVQHIWSKNYLDLRFTYQTGKPLLCAALRVWELETPIRYELREQDLGCRSWVEWEVPLTSNAEKVLSGAKFKAQLQSLEKTLS